MVRSQVDQYGLKEHRGRLVSVSRFPVIRRVCGSCTDYFKSWPGCHSLADVSPSGMRVTPPFPPLGPYADGAAIRQWCFVARLIFPEKPYGFNPVVTCSACRIVGS